MRAIAHTDGGNRKHIAASACVVLTEHGEIIEKHKVHLGTHTNSYAEYHGVILALDTALASGITRLSIFSDSQFMVEQLNGRYEVRTETMRPLRDRCWFLANELELVSITHVPREENAYADALCNWWMDHACGDIRPKWDKRLKNLRLQPPFHLLVPQADKVRP